MMTDHEAPGGLPVREAMQFIQSLKGAPASVLLALAFSGRFMSHKDLQVWTRCGHAQVTAALRVLMANGWAMARTTRGPWAFAGGHHLPVQAALDPSNALKALSSGSDSLNHSREEIPLLSARREQMLDVMYAAGIREPTASELAGLPHMTLEYLQAHITAARAHGLRIGAAVEAMRLNAPAPLAPEKRDRQAEVADKIRRFMEGG